MGRHVLFQIVEAFSNIDPYFQQKMDGKSKKGLFPLQKSTAAMRILAYGVFANAVDVCRSTKAPQLST